MLIRYYAFRTQKLRTSDLESAGVDGIIFQLLVTIVLAGIAAKVVTALVITGYKDLQKQHKPTMRGIDGDLKLLACLFPSDVATSVAKVCCRTVTVGNLPHILRSSPLFVNSSDQCTVLNRLIFDCHCR